MKIKTKIIASLLVLTVFLTANTFAAVQIQPDLPLAAYGLDTAAGYATVLRTSKTVANAPVTFTVLKPTGESVIVSAKTSANGVAIADLSDYHTKQAGFYTVSATVDGYVTDSRSNVFEVYSGSVSDKNSVVSPSDQVVHSFSEKATVSVLLLDDYGNPVPGHVVKLISSSSADEIWAAYPDSTTDESGKIVFEMRSTVSGAATYSVYDVTADIILAQKAKVVYFTSGDFILSNTSPSLSYAASGSSSTGISKFKFESVPASVKTGEHVNFDLVAYDVADQVVTNYVGTVRFSVLSGNASYVTLPPEYTFKASDLGSHTFSLALLFQQPGSYQIEAKDSVNMSVLGTYTFNAMSSSGASASTGITITNPSAGTFSNNVQVISGKASPGASLKIFDNDVTIASLVADIDGDFSHTTGILVDGQHKIYVASVNEVGTAIATSPLVTITVDTSAPEISQVTLDPTGSVNPSAIITIRVFTNDDLSRAQAVVSGNVYDLTKSTQGYYQGTFPAPIDFGTYPINLVLVDQLGNETTLENQASLQVGVMPPSTDVPDDVPNVRAVAEDFRVTLNWDAPSSENAITHYRIFYGTSPNQLTEAVDTFTNATTWYVPNLQNGTEYYFGVAAVDSKGNMSENFLKLVSSTPHAIAGAGTPPDVAEGAAGKDAIEEMKGDVSDTGPEILWLVILSLMGGGCYTAARKRF